MYKQINIHKSDHCCNIAVILWHARTCLYMRFEFSLKWPIRTVSHLLEEQHVGP